MCIENRIEQGIRLRSRTYIHVKCYKHSMPLASGIKFPSGNRRVHRPPFHSGRCFYLAGLHPLSVHKDWRNAWSPEGLPAAGWDDL